MCVCVCVCVCVYIYIGDSLSLKCVSLKTTDNIFGTIIFLLLFFYV